MACSHLPVSSRRRLRIACQLAIFWTSITGPGLHADGLDINSELHLGTWSPFASQWESLSTVCAWSDSSYDFYHVTASNLTTGSDFELTNGIGDSVAYSVYWRGDEASSVWEKLLFEVLSGNSYGYAGSPGCIGGPTAEVRIQIDSADINTALPGVYSDTLLLTLSPL